MDNSLSDAHWALILETINGLAEDEGIALTPETGFALFQKHWHLLDDLVAITAFTERKRAAAKTRHIAELRATLEELENE